MSFIMALSPITFSHQEVVVHFVEELCDVHIYDVGEPFVRKAPGRFDGIMGTASGSKSVAAFAESGLEHGLQDSEQ